MPVNDAIDNVIQTLWWNEARNYCVDSTLWSAEGAKRIRRIISGLEKGEQRRVEAQTRYKQRLEALSEFHKMPRQEREEILRLVKEKRVPIEEAYRLRAGQ